MKSYKNKYPLDYYNELEKEEINIYNEMYFENKDIKTISNINCKDVLSRDIVVFEDYDYNLLQNMFIISSYNGQKIVGRKIRSVLRIENKINAINCSMITSPMLLGFLKKKSKKGRKKYIFEELKSNRLYDIYYPI